MTWKASESSRKYDICEFIYWKICIFAGWNCIFMTFSEAYIQMKAFARIDGVVVGVLWLLGFACFVGMFRYPICGMLCMIIVLMTPFLIAMRVGRFRDQVLEGFISFRRAFGYSLYVFFYASILLAVGVAVYFHFFDHGFVADQFNLLLSSPEIGSYARRLGYSESLIQASIDVWKNVRPIDIALQTILNTVFLGAIASALIALAKRRPAPTPPPYQQ